MIIYIYIYNICYRSACESQSKNLINPNVLNFFTVTESDGISLNAYKGGEEVYNSRQLVTYEKSGSHRRGGINGYIYIVAGGNSNNVKIYRKHSFELLQTSSHSNAVSECFYQNSVYALCCDMDGYIKKYNLNDYYSIPLLLTLIKQLSVH